MSFAETNTTAPRCEPCEIGQMEEHLNEESNSANGAVRPKKFDELGLSPRMLSAVTKLGFENATPVQAQAIPAALGGNDLIIQSHTGSGKTLAFALPLLDKMIRSDARRGTFGIVITPTRELASQIRDVMASLGEEFRPACLIGGVSSHAQTEELKEDTGIVVGTPGRLLDMIRQRKLKLKDCRYFVLDEADEMLSMGFLEDMRAILARIPESAQGLFVSATITGRVGVLASSFLHKPEIVSIDSSTHAAPAIEHFYVEVAGDIMAKPSAVCDLIETLRPSSSIIFCNTKSDTELLEVWLRRRGFAARRINSDLTQRQRDAIMRKLRSGDVQYLIATDVAARGLDVDHLDLIVNYSIHEQPEIYVHRTGRTGRAGRSGRAVSLVGPLDLASFYYLKKNFEKEIKKLPLPGDEEIVDARLAHLHEIVRQMKMDIGKRESLLASKLLKDLGAEFEPSDELLTVVAKLSRQAVEHFISSESKSLEEEIPASGGDEGSERRADDGERRGRSGGEGRERDRGRHGDRDRHGDRSRGRRRRSRR